MEMVIPTSTTERLKSLIIGLLIGTICFRQFSYTIQDFIITENCFVSKIEFPTTKNIDEKILEKLKVEESVEERFLRRREILKLGCQHYDYLNHISQSGTIEEMLNLHKLFYKLGIVETCFYMS